MSIPDQEVADTGAPDDVDGDPQVVPPVVIVMVTHDPGKWFEPTLRSITRQTYASHSLLVVDTSDGGDVSERVAAVVPDAHHHRVEGNPGFGAACNEALRVVQGAAFYLLCHDDIALAPDALQVMVEEAFRSNAGIVGPKLVDWHIPDYLLSAGMGADKTGYPAPVIEPGELDQAQHDTVRDVFYVPGATTLIRADLFAALNGFDDGMTFHGEDLDLCWRTHVAGARVVIAPSARVAHLEKLGERRPIDDRRRLQMRHRLRAMRVASTWWTRVRVVPQAALLALAEVVYSLLLGRVRQARDVAGAWTWNSRHRGEVRKRRSALEKIRIVPDREVRQLQVRGSARLSAFLRGQIGSTEDRLLSVQRTREVTDTLRSSKARTAVLAWLAVLAVLVVGSRDLLVGHIASIGDMPVLGDSPLDLLRTWASGYRSVGLGAVEANPTAIGLMGAMGLVFLGALQLLTKVLVLGLLPLGAAGMWRLTKPIGSRRSRIVSLVVYVAIPLPYNAIANGQWTGLVAYAFVPWVLGQLAKASAIAPYGDIGGDPGPGVRPRPMLHRIVAVGVLTGLASMASASIMGLTLALAVALAVGGALAGTMRGAGRVLLVGVAGTVVALALQLPWSTTFVSGDWRALTGASTVGDAIELGNILRFESGPLGAGLLSYLFLGAAALPLVIGRSWRLGWAVRSWVLVLASFATVLAQAEGWLSWQLPAAELLLAPGAVGIAVAAGMGMAAFEVDLPDYHFGWRQILSVLAGAALVLAVLPMIGATIDGRWEMPRGDFARALSFVDREGDETPFRVLWMGEASVLPLASWPLDEQAYGEPPRGEFAYATSDNGTPSLDDRWPERDDGATEQLGDVLSIAGEGGTSRLGALLAPMGVRYIVVPLGAAPEPAPVTSQPDTVLATLDAQLDLAPVTTAGVVLYRNNVWGPTRALLPSGTEAPSGGPALADRFYPSVEGAPVAAPDTDGVERFSGTIDEPSTVYLAEASSDDWELVVDGSGAAREEVMGWANQFDVENTGSTELRFRTPTVRYLVLAGQVVLWVVALIFLLRVRVMRDEGRSLQPSDAPKSPGEQGADRS